MGHMVEQGNSFLKIALQLFLGELILDVCKNEDETVTFVTAAGSFGFMGPNYLGNWDIWIGEEIVYEIEQDLYEIIQHEKDENIIALYGYIRNVEPAQLKYKSKKFLEVVQMATENLILNYTLPLKGQVKIGYQEVIYKNGKKAKIQLN